MAAQPPFPYPQPKVEEERGHVGDEKAAECVCSLPIKIGLSLLPRSKGDSAVEDGHPDQARHKHLPPPDKNLDRCRTGVLDSKCKRKKRETKG